MGKMRDRQFLLPIIAADSFGTTSTSYLSVIMQAVVSVGPKGENQQYISSWSKTHDIQEFILLQGD